MKKKCRRQKCEKTTKFKTFGDKFRCWAPQTNCRDGNRLGRTSCPVSRCSTQAPSPPPPPECSGNVPVVVNTSDLDHVLLCSSYEKHTSSKVHVWKRLMELTETCHYWDACKVHVCLCHRFISLLHSHTGLLTMWSPETAAQLLLTHILLLKAETRALSLRLEGLIVPEMNHLHIPMLWETVYGRARERKRRSEWGNNFIKHIICPVTLGLVTSVCSRARQLHIYYVSARAHSPVRVWRHVWRVHVRVLLCMQQYKTPHQHRPHFSSLFDAFKMLITGLLCATSNANALFYCREVGPTLAFAYLMSVSLACMEELGSGRTHNK